LKQEMADLKIKLLDSEDHGFDCRVKDWTELSFQKFDNFAANVNTDRECIGSSGNVIQFYLGNVSKKYTENPA
jgi:hypothetical protein